MDGKKTDGPVAVLGGTGHLGSRIVEALGQKRVPVRVLSRNADRARQLLGPTVDVVEGDIEDAGSVARVLTGARSLVVAISAFSPGLVRRLWAIEHDGVIAGFAAAERLGVQRVVYVSAYELRQDLIDRFDVDVGRLKTRVEAALRASNLNWTILGAAPAMDIFFAFIRGNAMNVPGGGPPALPSVASSDLGEICAQAALREDLSGTRFRMTGPEAVSFPAAARRIGRVWERNIRFRKIPLAIPRTIGFISRPVVPFVYHLVCTLRMMNNFPEDLAAAVPADHRRLLETFDYAPRTLEDEAAARALGPHAAAQSA